MADTGNTKIALIGFSRVSIFPVIQNDTEGYEVGERIALPWATEMTKDPDTSETKIYGDDMLYLNLKSWNGLNSTLTLLEMPLEMFETLGFGTYDDTTKTLKWNPQGKNKEYAMTFRCKRVDDMYRMYRMFSFTINELKDSGMKTKGDGTEVNSYQLVGTFTARKYDDVPGEIHDGDDLDWLDEIETV